MRTFRHKAAGTPIGLQFTFELSDHFFAEHMLHHIGITVDAARRHVRVFDEVEFPEAVVTGKVRCLGQTSYCQLDRIVLRRCLDQTFMIGTADVIPQMRITPRPPPSNLPEGNGAES